MFRSWLVVVLSLLALVLTGGDADAGKKKKKEKYNFQLQTTRAQAGVEGKLAADAMRLLEAEVKKAFATHPQMVADLTGAPDPAKDPKGYAKWLKKKNIKGSYLVNVDLTLYTEETEDNAADGGKRFVVRLELHMFGETIPERKMAFEGAGRATVKQDVGKKVRKRDREFTIQSAIELAVADAMAEGLRKLALPPPKPKK